MNIKTREEEIHQVENTIPPSVSTWSLDFITGQNKGFNDGIRAGKAIAISKLEEFISDRRKMFGLIGHKEEFINCFKRYVEE